MGLFDSFINPGKAYEDAQEQMDRYYRQGQGYLDPYNRYGRNQYRNLNEYIQNFMDPVALQDQWSNAYKESDYAKNAEALAQEHGLNAASAMGLLGSNTALNAIQQGTSQIAAADRQNYLNDLMQKYLSGAGLAQNIFGIGANAAGQQSQNAMNMGQQSAGMAYGRAAAPGNLLGGLIGIGGGILGSALGGPLGGALASRWNLSGGNNQLPAPFQGVR